MVSYENKSDMFTPSKACEGAAVGGEEKATDSGRVPQQRGNLRHDGHSATLRGASIILLRAYTALPTCFPLLMFQTMILPSLDAEARRGIEDVAADAAVVDMCTTVLQ